MVVAGVTPVGKVKGVKNTVAAVKMAKARALGRAGESAAGITKNTKRIFINNRVRIPDGLDKRNLVEVKNVKYLSATQQILDYATYAKRNKLKFTLHIRKNTTLSKPLLKLIKTNNINVIRSL